MSTDSSTTTVADSCAVTSPQQTTKAAIVVGRHIPKSADALRFNSANNAIDTADGFRVSRHNTVNCAAAIEGNLTKINATLQLL